MGGLRAVGWLEGRRGWWGGRAGSGRCGRRLQGWLQPLLVWVVVVAAGTTHGASSCGLCALLPSVACGHHGTLRYTIHDAPSIRRCTAPLMPLPSHPSSKSATLPISPLPLHYQPHLLFPVQCPWCTAAKSFEELGLSQELLQGLYTEMKFERPSRIQVNRCCLCHAWLQRRKSVFPLQQCLPAGALLLVWCRLVVPAQSFCCPKLHAKRKGLFP